MSCTTVIDAIINIDSHDIDNAAELAEASIPCIFSNIINLISFFIIAFCILNIIKAGIGYITSQGNPEKLENSKNTILWSLLGLAFSFSILLIIRLISSIFGFDADQQLNLDIQDGVL